MAAPSPRFLRHAAAWVAIVSAATILGCGSHSDMGTVNGVVKLNGNPLVDASVQFQPEQGRQSAATTDANGKYSLRYGPSQMGAKVGKHTVRITTSGEKADSATGKRLQVKEVLPPRYNAQSELKREVKAGSNQVDFDLTAP